MRRYHQQILERLHWSDSGPVRPLCSLGITSSYLGEGVTTIAANLAVTAARRGDRRVLLVDCNLAHPCISRLLGVAASPGLAELVHGEDREDALHQPTEIKNLWVLSAGQLRGSPARTYYSARLPRVMQDLADGFDLLIFDLPPAGQASCTSRMAGMLDGVLLVVEAGRVRREAAKRTKELLLRAEAKVLGAVLNKRREWAPERTCGNP